MSEEIVFTIRLTSDDWDSHLRAWRCPAIDIPSAFIKEVRDAKGQPVAVSLLKIDKGPARLTWNGSGQPSQIAVVVGLREELSPTSEEHFWKRLTIVVPVITAIIAGAATWLSKPGPNPTSHAPNQIQYSIVVLARDNLNTVFKQLDDLNNAINGNICSGGAHGVPSPDRGGLSQATTAISSKLRGISSDLERALANSGAAR